MAGPCPILTYPVEREVARAGIARMHGKACFAPRQLSVANKVGDNLAEDGRKKVTLLRVQISGAFVIDVSWGGRGAGVGLLTSSMELPFYAPTLIGNELDCVTSVS